MYVCMYIEQGVTKQSAQAPMARGDMTALLAMVSLLPAQTTIKRRRRG